MTAYLTHYLSKPKHKARLYKRTQSLPTGFLFDVGFPLPIAQCRQ